MTDRPDSAIEYAPPKRRIFLRFVLLSCLISSFTVVIYGLSIIPSQKKKIISGLKNYTKLIHSALYPVVSSSIILEDYGEAIENSLTVLKENSIVLYVIFARKDGFTIINLKEKWYQVMFTSKENTAFINGHQNETIVNSAIVQQEVFNMCYPFNYSGIEWGNIYIGLSTEGYHADLKLLYLRSFWIALLSVMLGLYLSFVLARRLTHPIQTLVQTTSKIGAGDLTARSNIKTGDEIEMLGNAINQMVAALKNSRDEAKKNHDALLEAAHRAGMAEVAIDVLHNVGNVLNSINVVSSAVKNRVAHSRVDNIRLFVEDIEANIGRLYEYLNSEGRTEKMIHFLKKLSKHLEDENRAILKDMGTLSKHVNHIVEIVNFQQLYSKPENLMERVSINELIHMAIQICSPSLVKNRIRLVFENVAMPDMIFDRHKMIQILNNLINNAIDAVLEGACTEKKISISVLLTDDHFLLIRVEDNGIGIPAHNLIKIFNHGFTTKKTGHGFGLHSCALFAQEMKGTLNVSSLEWNKGALLN